VTSPHEKKRKKEGSKKGTQCGAKKIMITPLAQRGRSQKKKKEKKKKKNIEKFMPTKNKNFAINQHLTGVRCGVVQLGGGGGRVLKSQLGGRKLRHAV